jgi:AAA domain
VEGATILAGRPKIGKSWLALDWGLAVARDGFVFGDVHCKQGEVLYVALEDNERRLKQRITKLLGLSMRRSSWTLVHMLQPRHNRVRGVPAEASGQNFSRAVQSPHGVGQAHGGLTRVQRDQAIV